MRSLWQRFRNWLAKRTGLLRGRWTRAELEASVARWTWWPLPWSRASWSYAIYRPAGLADDKAAPLVVVLHGCGQQAMDFAVATGLTAAADHGRFRLLCPEQHDKANAYRCWNWFHPPAQSGQGELDVVLKALDATVARLVSAEVAVVGLSAGGGLAALLAFHHADRFAAVVTVAAPPLLGRVSLQDPGSVLKNGLSFSPTLATALLRRCAPLLVLHGADDEVVVPRCAEQLGEQALSVLGREFGALAARTLADGHEHLAGSRVVLRWRLLPGLGHAWSGALGGHPYVIHGGPQLTEIALGFLREAGVLLPT